MIANYHTHTWRCKHAEGLEREYVEQAIRAGVRILGFSDHTPYPFPDGYVSFFRMAPSQAEDYFTTLTDLKREYAGQIEIHIGVEAEYYPAHFEALLQFLAAYPCEYLIMGQHYTHNERDGAYSGGETDDGSVLTQYVSQVLQGLQTGVFTYLAHPDVLHWSGSEALYRQEMERLCRGAKALDIPLELNLLGLELGRNYPCGMFWEIAGQVGNCAVLGCDAHRPQALALPGLEARARAFADAHGVRLLETVELNQFNRKSRDCNHV